MEILLLGIYSFFVWLIFIKLKLLPWTTPWKVAVAIFPIVMIAILLLLLLTRVMVPDALILELHPHTHTIHAAHEDANKAQVGQKHKHCPVEDIFEAPFQGAYTSINFVIPLHKTAYYNLYQVSRLHSQNTSHYLRGPPIA